MRKQWCGTPVSNRRPSAWQADALPTELVPHWVDNITCKDGAFKAQLTIKLFTLIYANLG